MSPDLLPWILVVALAAVVGWLLVSRRPAQDPGKGISGGGAQAGDPELPLLRAGLRRLTAEMEAGRVEAASPPDEPDAVARLRATLAEGWAPAVPSPGGRGNEDPMQAALQGVLTYLERGVLPSLREARDLPDPGEALQDALDALEDLAFYAAPPSGEEPRRENLASLVQEVTREYTLETGIPLRVRGPERPIHFQTLPEALKDTVFLLLANAGRWGEGRTVDLTLAQSGERVLVTVADRGPGFTPEALERGFEPFWTSEPDALGMGLTHARSLVLRMGGEIRLANAEEGGGSVTLSLPPHPGGGVPPTP